MGRKLAYSTGPGNIQEALYVGEGSKPRGVYLSLRQLIIVFGFVVSCIIVVPIIVHFARPCQVRSAALVTDAFNRSEPTAAPPKLVTDVRLATDVKPIHYSLILAPFVYSNKSDSFYFKGSVNISVQVTAASSNFKLHSNQLNISSIDVLDGTGKKLPQTVKYDPDRQWQSITMTDALQAGSNYTVVIDSFIGLLKPDLQGLYLSSYLENNATKYLVASQLEPTDARKVFPCFDEPAFKATFDVSLVRRDDFKAISNMPSKAVTNVSFGDWFNSTQGAERFVREDFATTPIMSTYLLAFIVSQFDYTASVDTKGRQYRTWARPELLGLTEYASRAVNSVTEYFEQYFNITYPLYKTDQAAVPDFAAGAMENWGLVMYREARLLWINTSDKASDMQYTANIISHEMAHMWFGNLVTPVWWDDLWLNEGFASFIQSLGVHQMHPQWQTDAQFIAQTQAPAFAADSGRTSHPIYVQVNNPSEISEIFDSITYNKGSSVLRMLYNSLGDDVFRVGISNYLKNNSYSNTYHTALYQSLTQQASLKGKKIDVAEVMDRWINQMGYPVVSCTRENGNQLLLSQQHFLSDPTQTPDPRYPSPYNFTWIIPVTIATGDNASSVVGTDVSHLVQWMRMKSQRFSISTVSWYLLNLRSAGFYRVNYDTVNWKALIRQLQMNHSVFTPHDIARLLDDSFTLASAGYISYSIPLEMTKYLKNETHLVPWQSALSKLSYIHSMLHRQSPEYGPFSAYMRSLLTPMYRQLGIQKKPSDSHLTLMTREVIASAACRSGLKQCKSEADSQFQRFISSRYREIIEPDIRRTVLCDGIANSDSEVWDELFRLQRSETHPGMQNDLIRALGCSREPWVLSRYLNFTLSDAKVRRQDASAVLASVSRNPIGLQIVWDFLRNHWSRIQSRHSGLFSLSRYISNLAEFNSDRRLSEMIAFKSEHSQTLGPATRAMDNALESVKRNQNWMASHLPAVSDWLNGNL